MGAVNGAKDERATGLVVSLVYGSADATSDSPLNSVPVKVRSYPLAGLVELLVAI